MKAFFKENNKIIINSMDYTESLVGKQFLEDLAGKVIYAQQRNDINDDFDGLVLEISDIPTAGDLQVYPTTEPQEILAGDYGFSRVLVDPVNSTIDSNIQPYNIKKGISIESTLLFTLKLSLFTRLHNDLVLIISCTDDKF